MERLLDEAAWDLLYPDLPVPDCWVVCPEPTEEQKRERVLPMTLFVVDKYFQA
jgi:hypothetical protein